MSQELVPGFGTVCMITISEDRLIHPMMPIGYSIILKSVLALVSWEPARGEGQVMRRIIADHVAQLTIEPGMSGQLPDLG